MGVIIRISDKKKIQEEDLISNIRDKVLKKTPKKPNNLKEIYKAILERK